MRRAEFLNQAEFDLCLQRFTQKESGRIILVRQPTICPLESSMAFAWEVSAAILLERENGIEVQDLADLVMETRLTGLGVRNRTGIPWKTLRTQLTSRCPYTRWFSVIDNYVTLVDRESASANTEVRATLSAINKSSTGQGTRNVPALPEEIVKPGQLLEGARKSIEVNAYERNPVARKVCIAFYGPICVVCGFKASEVYGPLTEGLIHVHHVKPLSKIDERYEVDPIADLRPVCPNCHAVIHWDGYCRTIEEVKQLYNAR